LYRYCLMGGFEYARVNEENKKWYSWFIHIGKPFRFTYLFSSEQQLRVVYEPCCFLLFYHLTFLSYTDGIWCRWGNHLWLGIRYFVWVLLLPYSLFLCIPFMFRYFSLFLYLNCLISGLLLTIKLTVAWNKTIKHYCC